MTASGAINVVWAAPAENFIPTFGENPLVTFAFGPVRESVVVGKLGVAENSWADTK